MCRLDGGTLFGPGESTAIGFDGGPDGRAADDHIGCGKLSWVSEGGGWDDSNGSDDGAGTEVWGGGGVWGGADEVTLGKPSHRIRAGNKIVETKALIVSTGAGHRHLDVPGEKELETKGVTYCATCDGALPMFRDQPVVVVGGGDSACEEATFLTRFASKVYLVHRRAELRASKIMAERALGNAKIQPVWNAVVESVEGMKEGKVTGVRIKDQVAGKSSILPCAGVFIAVGHVPNTQIFKKKLRMDEAGYLELGPGSRTNVEGVFGAGDCADKVYRQAITAAGMGCMAAIDAERYLAGG